MTEPDPPMAAAGPSGTPPAAPAGRWKTWALVISLGLNLFVAAALVGAGLRHHRAVHDVGFGPFTDVLTREDRAALRDAFMAAAPEFRDRRRVAAEEVARLAEALRAEPWDRAAAEDALARQGARAEERFALGRKLFLDRLDALTPAARAALAERIEQAMVRWRQRG